MKFIKHNYYLVLQNFNRAEDLSSVFCSELVAATLKVMNILSPEVNSSNCTPVDFTSTCRKPLKVCDGVQFKKEVRVYLNSPLRSGSAINQPIAQHNEVK